ncbi:hypothetical protein WSK_0342 [Novosphingobium sp. Rr 2-17]|uniref:energy transducer TonB n=1 Tax=Novosphingobium sp. Rr 2-17 TaxID=555793 RepID=UPI0002698E7A|nr:energy transducer TonB [Novosphingobium sp. Rr 2-17]EIZ80950.1 hypothetical protein WSK_0342 [Novosphingobium sp. Rr 2-17]
MTSLAAYALEDRHSFRGPTSKSGAIGPAIIDSPFAPKPGLAQPSEAAYERSVYRPSANARPLAIAAAASVIVAMVAALATLNISSEHHRRQHLTVIDVHDIDVTPPPPPAEPTKLDTPEPPSQTFVPKPMIELPAPGPQQAMVDAPPPPPPAAPARAVTTASAPAAAPPAPPAATTMDGGDLSSKVLYAKPPSYPIEARRAHEQGAVKLRLLIGSDGTVKDIQVASSSGSERLDHAALQAVRRWRWSPNTSDGVAVAVRGFLTITFGLS